MNFVARPGTFVILAQPLPKPVRLNPDNRVFFLIERRRSPQRLYRDAVLLKLFGLAAKMTFADVSKKAFEIWSPDKDTRLKYSLHLGLYFVARRIRSHL